MGILIARSVLKVSTFLFLVLGVLYFFKGDYWFAGYAKAAGITLALLLIAMIGSILAILIILSI